MKATIFADRFARQKQEIDLDWTDLVRRLESPQQYAKKEAAPLIKLATFGARRTETGSLRNDANMVTTGVIGDVPRRGSLRGGRA